MTKDFLEYYTKSHVEIIPGDSNLQAALLDKIKTTLAGGNKVYVFEVRDAAKFPSNKDFIPQLKREYGARMKLVEKELGLVWEVR